ncbi:MAG: hypothetical protein HW421_3094 [Ignavibacteria bacterium]|nr:hypothetical protein [Ignavibacteria bacterium]
MEIEQKLALIEHRIKKSKDTSDEAMLAFTNTRFGLALNRVYYSIFYIISALSVKFDFSTSKHKQLMGWFGHNFVKDGIVERKLFEIYKKAYDNRQESDYGDFVVYEEQEVKEQIDDMLIFIAEIEKLFKKA